MKTRALGAPTSRAEQLAVSLVVLAIGLIGANLADRAMLAALGVLAGLHGIVAFLRSGGNRVAPAGLFALTSGALIALGTEPAWVGEPVGGAFVGAAVAATLVQIWAMPTRPSFVAALDTPGRHRGAELDPADRPMAWAGLAMFALALFLSAGLGREVLPEFAALGATAAMAVVGTRMQGPIWQRMAVPGVATVIYAGIIHSGDGRLRLVAAGFVIVILASMDGEARWIKRSTVAAVPAAVVLLAWLRLRHIESTRPGGSAGRSGLESAVIPLRILRDLLDAQAENWGFAWGTSYLSVPVSFVPSWIPTPDADAIGYDLVAISAPDRVGSGYSLAGLSVAEWVFNFGWFTLPIFAVIVAWLLLQLDRMLAACWTNDRRRRSSGSLLLLAGAVTLVAGLPDFAWAGSHTYVMRSLLKVLPIVVLVAVVEVARRSVRKVKTMPTTSELA